MEAFSKVIANSGKKVTFPGDIEETHEHESVNDGSENDDS